jgi:hypothetical protein
VRLCSVGFLSVTLLGCGQVQPQQVCAAADTLSNLQELLNQTALKDADKAQSDSLGAALMQLWTAGNIKFDLIALKSVDRDTKKIECGAQLQIRLSDPQRKAGDLANLDAEDTQHMNAYIFPITHNVAGDFKDGEATADLTFSRQPSADGKGYLYGFEGPTGTSELLRFAAATQIAATKQVAAASTPAAAPSPVVPASFTLPASPPPSDAASADPKPDSVAPGSLTGTIEFHHDAAGGSYAIVSNGQSYTLGYVWNIPDDVQDKLSALEDGKAVVTAKGDIETWKDGSKGFSNQAPITISR